MLGKGNDGPSTDEERFIDHLPVDHEGSYSPCSSLVGSRQDTSRLLDLGRTRHETLIRDRDLRGVDAALAGKSEVAGLLAFLPEPPRQRRRGGYPLDWTVLKAWGSERLMPHGSKRSA